MKRTGFVSVVELMIFIMYKREYIYRERRPGYEKPSYTETLSKQQDVFSFRADYILTHALLPTV